MNNSRLPDNFSDMVMNSIQTEIARRESRDEKMMYALIAGIGIMMLGVLGYMVYRFEWISQVKEYSFNELAHLKEYSLNPVWIIALVNSLLLIGLFSYITHKREKASASVLQ